MNYNSIITLSQIPLFRPLPFRFLSKAPPLSLFPSNPSLLARLISLSSSHPPSPLLRLLTSLRLLSFKSRHQTPGLRLPASDSRHQTPFLNITTQTRLPRFLVRGQFMAPNRLAKLHTNCTDERYKPFLQVETKCANHSTTTV